MFVRAPQLIVNIGKASEVGKIENTNLRAHTAGSVISSLSPAAIIVLTNASIPPT